jgi:hypothetical protein
VYPARYRHSRAAGADLIGTCHDRHVHQLGYPVPDGMVHVIVADSGNNRVSLWGLTP